MKKVTLILLLFVFNYANAQNTDTCSAPKDILNKEKVLNQSDSLYKISQPKLPLKSLILPAINVAGKIKLFNGSLG